MVAGTASLYLRCLVHANTSFPATTATELGLLQPQTLLKTSPSPRQTLAQGPDDCTSLVHRPAWYLNVFLRYFMFSLNPACGI
jgi:hypothetical protein